MADNVAITAGTGTIVATDEAGGAQYQRVKITDGTADSVVHLKVVAEDAAHTTGDTGLVAMAVRQDTAAALGTTDGDYMPLIVDATGRLWVHSADLATIAAAVSTQMQVDVVAALPAGTNTIGATRDAGPAWTSVFGVSGAAFESTDASTPVAVTDAPSGGEKLVIDDIVFGVDTAMQVDFTEETSGTVIFSFFAGANTNWQFTPRGKVKLATADKKLFVDTSVAGNIAVTISYHSEA